MEPSLQKLLQELKMDPKEISTFQPHVSYNSGMDRLTYLMADVAYRAHHIDQWLILCLHPQEDYLVGVIFMDFKRTINQMHAKHPIPENRLLPLPQYLDWILEMGREGDVNNARENDYHRAYKCVRQTVLTPEDVRK